MILNEINLQGIFLQQDDVILHFANVTKELLGEYVGKPVISRKAAVRWPPRSCDLNPMV